jgi:hypothetical protein
MLLEQKKTVGCNPNCQDIAWRSHTFDFVEAPAKWG